MNNSATPWEHGSEFHWLSPAAPGASPGVQPWSDNAVHCGSGRDALRAILRYGIANLGWQRILLPSFLCREVVTAVANEGLAIETYADDPRDEIAAPCPAQHEALLIVNTFGIRTRWSRPTECVGAVIEDHTHDPWSEWANSSEAMYCFASLRKTLPIPDGGVLWSPIGQSLPPRPPLTAEHQGAVACKLESMLLKALYIEGHRIEKSKFRRLALAGEERISAHEISGISTVSAAVAAAFASGPWREARRNNFLQLSQMLAKAPHLEILKPRNQEGAAFSVILVCPDERVRDQLRNRLIGRAIYPAVLWPLEDRRLALPSKTISLSRRILCLHCDGRYSPDDLQRVAATVLESL